MPFGEVAAPCWRFILFPGGNLGEQERASKRLLNSPPWPDRRVRAEGEEVARLAGGRGFGGAVIAWFCAWALGEKQAEAIEFNVCDLTKSLRSNDLGVGEEPQHRKPKPLNRCYAL